MALRAAPTAIGRPGPNLTVLRGRRADHRTEAAELLLEVAVLADERDRLGDELHALARRLELAIHAERPDVALHVVGRLDALSSAMCRRSGGAA